MALTPQNLTLADLTYNLAASEGLDGARENTATRLLAYTFDVPVARVVGMVAAAWQTIDAELAA